MEPLCVAYVWNISHTITAFYNFKSIAAGKIKSHSLFLVFIRIKHVFVNRNFSNAGGPWCG